MAALRRETNKTIGTFSDQRIENCQVHVKINFFLVAKNDLFSFLLPVQVSMAKCYLSISMTFFGLFYGLFNVFFHCTCK